MAGAAKVRDIPRLLKKVQGRYMRGLNEPTKEALASYQYEGDTLNRYLRQKSLGRESSMEDIVDFMETIGGIDETMGEPAYWNYGSAEAKKVERQGMDMVKRIDEAIRKAPRVDEPLTLHRRIGMGTLRGEEFTNPGFTSTSTHAELAAMAGVPGGHSGGYYPAKSTLMEIEIPPNKPLLSMELNPKAAALNYDESEILLPRNLRIKRIGEQRIPADLRDLIEEGNFPGSMDARLTRMIKKYRAKQRGGLVHGNA